MKKKFDEKQMHTKVYYMNRGRLTKRMRELDQEWFLRKSEHITPDTQ